MQSVNWDDLRYFLEVARTQRVSGAAKHLGVDHTTVARHVRELEMALSTVLFDKSRADGFVLTAEGQRLLAYADAVETTVQSAAEQFTGGAHSLSGHVRIGSTEGFGCFFLSPQLARFTGQHPDISIDLLPVPQSCWSGLSEANTSTPSCATTGSSSMEHAIIWIAIRM
jgi:DNA-binding transcriptional LysR family regulator